MEKGECCARWEDTNDTHTQLWGPRSTGQVKPSKPNKPYWVETKPLWTLQIWLNWVSHSQNELKHSKNAQSQTEAKKKSVIQGHGAQMIADGWHWRVICSVFIGADFKSVIHLALKCCWSPALPKERIMAKIALNTPRKLSLSSVTTDGDIVWHSPLCAYIVWSQSHKCN